MTSCDKLYIFTNAISHSVVMKLKDKEVWKPPSTMLGISVAFPLIPFPAVRVMEARTVYALGLILAVNNRELNIRA